MFRFFSAYNTFKNQHAQIATLLTLIIAIMFLFVVVTINIGKSRSLVTDVYLAANTAVHTVSSYLGSYSRAQWEFNDNHMQQCELDVLALIFTITTIIATIVTIYFGGVYFGKFAGFEGKLGLLSKIGNWVKEGIQYVWTEALEVMPQVVADTVGPAVATVATGAGTPLGHFILAGLGLAASSFNLSMYLVDSHNAMKASNKRLQHLPFKDQIREMGIQQALGGSVDDSILVVDAEDIDEDTYRDDRISRFDSWYFKRMLNLWAMEKKSPKSAALNELYDAVTNCYNHLTGSGGTYSLDYFDEDSPANANGLDGSGTYPDEGTNDVYLDADDNDFGSLLYAMKNTWPDDSTIPAEMKIFYGQYIEDWWVSPKIPEKPGHIEDPTIWWEDGDQLDLFLLYMRQQLNNPDDGLLELLREVREMNLQVMNVGCDAWLPILKPHINTIEKNVIPLLEQRRLNFKTMRDIAAKKVGILHPCFLSIHRAYRALGGLKGPLGKYRQGSLLYDLCNLCDKFKRFEALYSQHEENNMNWHYKTTAVYSWKVFYKDETSQRIGRWHHAMAEVPGKIKLPYIEQTRLTPDVWWEGLPEICYTLRNHSGTIGVNNAKFNPGTEGKYIRFAGGIPLWKFRHGGQVGSIGNDFDALDKNDNGIIDEEEVFSVGPGGNIYYVSKQAKDLHNKRLGLLKNKGIRGGAEGFYSCSPCNPNEPILGEP